MKGAHLGLGARILLPVTVTEHRPPERPLDMHMVEVRTDGAPHAVLAVDDDDLAHAWTADDVDQLAAGLVRIVAAVASSAGLSTREALVQYGRLPAPLAARLTDR